MKKIVIIDNYDSFVYNIYQYVSEVEPDAEIKIYRNDKIKVSELNRYSPTHIIISPGPGRPENAGNSPEIVEKFSSKIPILGVCLGHQIIGMVFGGKIIHAKQVVHGKTSLIYHTGTILYDDIPNPFEATRYHSLVVEEKTLPDSLIVTAKGEEEIMGIQHRKYPVFGVQFHPESILTTSGKTIIKNFFKIEKGKFIYKITETTFKVKKNVIENGIQKLLDKENLTYEETVDIMNRIMEGKAKDSQISAFLIALRMKGESPEEIAGMAKVMQDKAVFIQKPSEICADTCGTGGDKSGTFNISTTTAFVVAAGNIPVAKHGNRSVSSTVGSADVLEAGGYRLQKSKEEMEKELKDTGFSFLFAPLLHPAMKSVMPVRRELKIRTAFNLLGPVTNPARVKYQIVGVFDFNFAPHLAKALQTLGTKKSLVISGYWTDELTVCDENHALLVTEKEITPFEIDIKKLGLHKGDKRELEGEEDPQKSFWLMQQILKGKGNKTQTETVALNAGVVFYLTGETKTVKDGVEKAIDIIISKKGFDKLEEVIDYQK